MNREKLPFEAPYVTTPQMVEVDRAMIEDFKIELIQMMENAGRNLAHLTRIRFLDGDPQGRRVIVLAGGGGNGGGALVAARRLHNWGASVDVILGQPPSATSEIPAHQLEIVERMDISVMAASAVANLAPATVILDGLIGYGLKGPPRGAVAALIRWANGQSAPTVALDVPSGVDTTNGTFLRPSDPRRRDHDAGSAERRAPHPRRRATGRRALPCRHQRATGSLSSPAPEH